MRLLISTLIFICCFFSMSFAKNNLICVLPQNNINNLDANYLKLLENKTFLTLDKKGKISKVTSPKCNKLDSYSQWKKKFLIRCSSNDNEKVEIEINSETLKFKKRYLRNDKNISLLFGFCVKKPSV